MWEGARDQNRNCNILTPNLWPSALCLSHSPDAQPEAQRPTLLGDGFLYCILSATSLDPYSLEPQGPFGLMWLSLPHLIYNSVQSLTGTGTNWLLSWLSYIIVQRPLSRLLDFWNRMLDHHSVEITLMQFTGHSLPVHQSMSVPWEFFTSSHFISQFPPMQFPLITAIRMCHLLLVHHLGMAFLARSKAKIQQYHVTFSIVSLKHTESCKISVSTKTSFGCNTHNMRLIIFVGLYHFS